ncbi:MAG TPA: hypothetical protein VGC60_04660, partial [Pyrinomonadaceae bacterium]
MLWTRNILRLRGGAGAKIFRALTAHCSLRTFFFLLLTAHCSLLTVFASPWIRQPSGTMAWLHSVYFLDRNQ